jgi:competence CoiA-like predicted nuclease
MIWAIKDNQRVSANPKDTAKCPICNAEVISKCGVVKAWHWSHKDLTDCDAWSEPESKWHLDWKNEFIEAQQEVSIEKDGIKHRADIENSSGLIIELQNSPISSDDICDREIFYDNMIWLLNGETLGKNFEIRQKPSYFTFIWKNPPQSFFSADKQIFIDLTKQKEELTDMLLDVNNRLAIIFNLLKTLINGDPHTFNFHSIKYNNREQDIAITEKHKIWCELSEECRNYEKQLKLFEDGEIFIIKKLYTKIPCAGWGYLMSKEDFLEGYG